MLQRTLALIQTVLVLVNTLAFLVLDMSSGQEWNVDFKLDIITKFAHLEYCIVTAPFKVSNFFGVQPYMLLLLHIYSSRDYKTIS